MGTRINSSKNNYAFSDNEYAYITMSADQSAAGTIDSGDPFLFNTLSAGNITFNPATYQFTLKKNRTYKMTATTWCAFSSASGRITFQFYNVTAAASVGTKGYIISAEYGSAYSTQPIASYTVTPTVDSVFEVRLGIVENLTKMYAAYSSLEIQQINIVSPVIQDPTRSNAYESPWLTLTVTSSGGGAGFSVIRARGQFYKTNEGTWHLKANICTTQTATTSKNILISGVVFQTTANNYQGCSAGTNVTSSGATGAYTNPNTNEITYKSESNYAYVMLSLDVELAGKPTGFSQIPTDI